MYKSIKEYKRVLEQRGYLKGGRLSEDFDGEIEDADFIPHPEDNLDTSFEDSEESEDTVTFETFKDAIIAEYESECIDEEGEETCAMLDEDQLKIAYEVFLKLSNTEESDDEDDEDEDEDEDEDDGDDGDEDGDEDGDDDDDEIEESKVNEMLKTSQDVKVSFNGEDLIIPKGTRVTNKTADGESDPNYNFVDDFSWYKPELKGFARKMAIHDMVHRGINIDSQYVINESKKGDVSNK